MPDGYVHGYDQRENARLQDQSGTLVELLHHDTEYPPGSTVSRPVAASAPRPSRSPGEAQGLDSLQSTSPQTRSQTLGD